MPPSSFLQVLAVVLFVLLAVEWTKRSSPTPVCVCTFSSNSTTAPPLRSVPVGFGDIFREKGTDKLHRHGYHRFYDPLLSALQHAPLTLLEVGADHGASMNSWSAYFTHSSAKFYGLAYGVKPSTHTDTRVTIISGDQSSCTDLQSLVSRIATKIDVIIDDGSHHPHHQLRSFLYLFPFLPPGGIYVIEDVETSYWDKPGASVYGYPLPGVGTGSTTSIIEFAKLLVEVINQRYMVTPDSYKRDFALFTPRVDPDVESVMFAQNIIVFRKKAVVEYDRVLDNLADGHSFQAFLRSSRVEEMLATARQLLCH